jgi:uncharacterized membrane protein YtjA (UPF0391 family)
MYADPLRALISGAWGFGGLACRVWGLGAAVCRVVLWRAVRIC